MGKILEALKNNNFNLPIILAVQVHSSDERVLSVPVGVVQMSRVEVDCDWAGVDEAFVQQCLLVPAIQRGDADLVLCRICVVDISKFLNLYKKNIAQASENTGFRRFVKIAKNPSLDFQSIAMPSGELSSFVKISSKSVPFILDDLIVWPKQRFSIKPSISILTSDIAPVNPIFIAVIVNSNWYVVRNDDELNFGF